MTATSLGLPAVRQDASAHPDGMPLGGPLVDTFGRVATDLRVSLTDRCNLRCTYCMPAEGLDWLPGDDLLTLDELTRLLTVAVTRLGITSVRFTGGEPLLYRGLEEVVAATAALRPRPEIALTTNGVGLARRAAGLAAAGLDRVNVSLDTVDPERFAAITRRDRLDEVLAGLAAAGAAGLGPVKVNAVLDPGSGLADAVELLRFCLRYGYQLRIIEQMMQRRQSVAITGQFPSVSAEHCPGTGQTEYRVAGRLVGSSAKSGQGNRILCDRVETGCLGDRSEQIGQACQRVRAARCDACAGHDQRNMNRRFVEQCLANQIEITQKITVIGGE